MTAIIFFLFFADHISRTSLPLESQPKRFKSAGKCCLGDLYVYTCVVLSTNHILHLHMPILFTVFTWLNIVAFITVVPKIDAATVQNWPTLSSQKQCLSKP